MFVMRRLLGKQAVSSAQGAAQAAEASPSPANGNTALAAAAAQKEPAPPQTPSDAGAEVVPTPLRSSATSAPATTAAADAARARSRSRSRSRSKAASRAAEEEAPSSPSPSYPPSCSWSPSRPARSPSPGRPSPMRSPPSARRDSGASLAAAAPAAPGRFRGGSLGSECGRPLRRSLATNRLSVSSVVRERARRSLAAAHRRSFVHRDFENPHAETCWLSCLFQSLWHSVVFHTAFDQHLSAARYETAPEESILFALQQTWSKYGAEDRGAPAPPATAGAPAASAAPAPTAAAAGAVAAAAAAEGQEALVPATDLAEAFGEGYGDMSEALALIQEELSLSPNPTAVGLAELMVLVPVVVADGVWPGPKEAQELVVAWGASESPLIAVDLAALEPASEEYAPIARRWIPLAEPAPGFRHRLVALVCYMWSTQHYVAFCARQRDADRALFFNDLPSLAPEAPRELPWSEVPALCEKYGFAVRLALYESSTAAAAAAAEPSDNSAAAAAAAVVS